MFAQMPLLHIDLSQLPKACISVEVVIYALHFLTVLFGIKKDVSALCKGQVVYQSFSPAHILFFHPHSKPPQYVCSLTFANFSALNLYITIRLLPPLFSIIDFYALTIYCN